MVTELPSLTMAELTVDMSPPTDDDVPMTLDWQPLDTREKLLAFLEAINRRRDAANGG
jgi:hypothetical protein